MIYLVGSIALRLMALTFLFPVIAKFTLAMTRPSYFEALAEQEDFAFRIGFDMVLIILGGSLLFRSTAERMLGYVGSRAIAILRAIIMSLLTAAGILMALNSLRFLGAIDSVLDDGVMMIAGGFWLVFFTCCVFPGWYRRKMFVDPSAAHITKEAITPTYQAADRRAIDTSPKPAPRAKPRGRAVKPPQTSHMNAGAWIATTLTFGLFSVIVIAGVHGSTTAHFLPTDSYLAQANALVVPLGVLCVVLLVLLVLIGPRPSQKTALGSPFWRTVLAVAVFYFGFYVCAEPALQYGLPDIHAKLTQARDRTVVAHVVAREQDYRRHRCNRTAYLRMDVGQGPQKYLVCDIPPDIWSGLTRGALLTVAGVETTYGFHYGRIARN